MDPVTLTTTRLALRAIGPPDTDAVYEACQDPDIQRWTTVPSPYLPAHAESFAEQMVPDGWRDGTMFTFGVTLRDEGPGDGPLIAVVGLTVRVQATVEIGFWTAKEHRGHGYIAEASLAACRWVFTSAGFDRVEWRAEVGNEGSRAAAVKAGFTLEGTLRSAMSNKGVRRDCWVGSLLPSDLGLPSADAYVPAREGGRPGAAG